MQLSSGHMVLKRLAVSEVGTEETPRPDSLPYIGRTGILSPGILLPLLNSVLTIFALCNNLALSENKVCIITDIISYYNQSFIITDIISYYNQSKRDREGGKTYLWVKMLSHGKQEGK